MKGSSQLVKVDLIIIIFIVHFVSISHELTIKVIQSFPNMLITLDRMTFYERTDLDCITEQV